MLSVILLDVIILNVIMLSVVAPSFFSFSFSFSAFFLQKCFTSFEQQILEVPRLLVNESFWPNAVLSTNKNTHGAANWGLGLML
jgi:hypothetical protein